ncbi:MAG: hypothetical protein JWR33_1946 [Naasia sp.]|nr:hypothetical protein [Naasia sp.]
MQGFVTLDGEGLMGELTRRYNRVPEQVGSRTLTGVAPFG